RPRISADALILLALVIAVLTFATPSRLNAQTPEELSYRVKAACLFNFLQFVEWPSDAFTNSDSSIVIGILGNDPFKGSLDEIIAGERIGGHPILIRRVRSVEDAAHCQLVFFPGSADEGRSNTLVELAKNHVLTVGESDGFAEKGGGINFTISGGKVRFEINTTVTKTANLSVSSKLLRLARLVTTTPGDQ